jgi:beta-phosphoglucomutase-like phosphatase (HAD superfamily)
MAKTNQLGLIAVLVLLAYLVYTYYSSPTHKESSLRISVGEAKARRFDLVIDGNKVSKSKPDPEVFLKGAAGLGIPANECIVFEDAQAGVEAAKAGNMRAIGIGNDATLGLADKIIPNFIGVKAVDLLQF